MVTHVTRIIILLPMPRDKSCNKKLFIMLVSESKCSIVVRFSFLPLQEMHYWAGGLYTTP